MIRQFALSLLLFSLPVLADPTTVRIGIKGMVCGFCAVGLKKVFSAQKGVSKVDVSLDKKEVVLQLDTGTTLDDKTITEKVKDSGYEVTGIYR